MAVYFLSRTQIERAGIVHFIQNFSGCAQVVSSNQKTFGYCAMSMQRVKFAHAVVKQR